jgi:hypothetical protein
MEDICIIIIDIIGSKNKPKNRENITLVANRMSQQRWL